MGRFERRQSKLIRRRLIIFGLIFIAVLIFISNIGLSLLADTSLYVTNVLSGKKQHTTNDFLGTLQLDEVSPATNSAQIMITGLAHGYDSIDFYLNDDKVGSTHVGGDENFNETIDNLVPGQNEIYVVAKSESRKKQKKSSIISVNYINK